MSRESVCCSPGPVQRGEQSSPPFRTEELANAILEARSLASYTSSFVHSRTVALSCGFKGTSNLFYCRSRPGAKTITRPIPLATGINTSYWGSVSNVGHELAGPVHNTRRVPGHLLRCKAVEVTIRCSPWNRVPLFISLYRLQTNFGPFFRCSSVLTVQATPGTITRPIATLCRCEQLHGR